MLKIIRIVLAGSHTMIFLLRTKTPGVVWNTVLINHDVDEYCFLFAHENRSEPAENNPIWPDAGYIDCPRKQPNVLANEIEHENTGFLCAGTNNPARIGFRPYPIR